MNAFRIPLPRPWPAGLLLLANACAHMPFRSSKEAAAREASSMATLQSSALRYADGYVSSVCHACDQAVREDPGRARIQLAALRWKLDQATAAYAYATGDNPVWNTLDLVVFAVVSRMAVEDPKSRETYGAAVDAAHRHAPRARGERLEPGRGRAEAGPAAGARTPDRRVARAESQRAQHRRDALSGIRRFDGERDAFERAEHHQHLHAAPHRSLRGPGPDDGRHRAVARAGRARGGVRGARADAAAVAGGAARPPARGAARGPPDPGGRGPGFEVHGADRADRGGPSRRW